MSWLEWYLIIHFGVGYGVGLTVLWVDMMEDRQPNSARHWRLMEAWAYGFPLLLAATVGYVISKLRGWS